jgi:serine/threonine protein kinase
LNESGVRENAFFVSPAQEIEKALFDAALNLSNPATREAFLAQTCAADPALRKRLEKLLADNDAAERFFDMDPVQTARRIPQPAAKPMPVDEKARDLAAAGVRIGRYKLIDRLGEGGCGIVYLAKQQEPVRRQVALKIIRLGMDTERVIARFEMERQALAMMNHPNIAQVFDAGATETGRPFFVMELVAGVRITDYCNEHRLGIDARLELFAQVCLAIQHAHQKGILHRDIKPSNVLVTVQDGAPVPKVIDFGIGKAIEGRREDDDSLTIFGQFIGTPAYMSPEQVETGGLDVDTRSDIYSLGALLYELLAGCPPFDPAQLTQCSVDEMRRLLREREPQSPSKAVLALDAQTLAEVAARRRCDPAKLAASLRGDLDWIVMKALDKDRQRRYATANGLAVDVQRHLRNEPVSARPPSRLYWFRKLVRRNRLAFAAGGALAMALILGLGTSSWLFLREREVRKQQARLLAEAEKNEMITRAAFLVRERKLAEANALLEQIHTPPQRPSVDGVSAFRAVGDWLAAQQKWQEASRRYAIVVHLDELDIWSSVGLDYQAYAVLLVETGDLATYAKFCRTTAARYARETNGNAAGRILKSCLLRPPDAELVTALQPLGKTVDRWGGPTSKPWAAIPISLWRYRCGDYRGAAELALPKEGQSDASAATATNCAILGMALFHEGKIEEARANLARARKIVNAGFARGLDVGNGPQGYWFDWVFARILLREAESTIR